MIKTERNKAVIRSLLAGIVATVLIVLLLIVGLAITAGNTFVLSEYATSLANADKLTVTVENNKNNGNGEVSVTAAGKITLTAKYYTPSCGDSEATTSTLTIAAPSSVKMTYVRDDAFQETAEKVPLTGTWDFSNGSFVLTVASTTSGNVDGVLTIQSITVVVDNTITLLPARQEGCSAVATIAGVTYTSGQKVTTPNLETTDENDVITSNQVTKSKVSSFTAGAAVCKEGYSFLGWCVYNDSGKAVVLKNSISGEVPLSDYAGSWYLYPVFLPKDATQLYTVKGQPYYFLDDAISAADGSNPVVVTGTGEVLLAGGNKVLIPSTVTVILPYDINQTGIKGASDKHPYANASYVTGTVDASGAILDPEEEVNVALTVPENVTIINNGKLILGGVISSSNGVAGGTAGKRSNLILHGTLQLGDDSILSACGYILGDGTITTVANDGNSTASIYAPFVVVDYRGGSYTVGVAGADEGYGLNSSNGSAQPGDENAVSPFYQYTVRNIQAELVLGSKAFLYGYVDLYAQSDHRRCAPMLVGSTGLIRLDSETELTATYDADVYIPTKRWIGRTSLAFEGGATFNSMSLTIDVGFTVDIQTNNISFPVPFNYAIYLNSGESQLNNSMVLLPGTDLVVGEDATLTVPKQVRLTVLDSYEDYNILLGGELAAEKTMTYYFLLEETLKDADTVKATLQNDFNFTAEKAYGYSGNEAFVYYGKDANGNARYMARCGLEYKFVNTPVTTTYKADSSSTASTNTKTAITKVTWTDPATGKEIVIYDGLDIVPTTGLSYKAVTEYAHPLFGQVVAEYGSYNNGYRDTTLIYKVKNEDGTYSYKWHSNGYTLDRVNLCNPECVDDASLCYLTYTWDVAKNTVTDNISAKLTEEALSDYVLVYARYTKPGTTSTSAPYSVGRYIKCEIPTTPTTTQVRKEFKNLLAAKYGENNYTIENWYVSSSSTPYAYKVSYTDDDGVKQVAYYYRGGHTDYTLVNVKLDEYGNICEAKQAEAGYYVGVYTPVKMPDAPNTSQIPAGLETFLANTYGEDNYVIQRWYTGGSSSTYKIYDVLANGKNVYYYKLSNTAYIRVNVKFNADKTPDDPTDNTIYEVTRAEGEASFGNLYYLQNTVKFEYRDKNNSKRISEHYSFNEDGTVKSKYYRYGASTMVLSAGLIRNSANAFENITYKVPKTTETVASEVVFEGVYGNDKMPALKRVSAAASYELIVEGVSYGKVLYEFVAPNGEIPLYCVYSQDSEKAIYIWKDGSMVTPTTTKYDDVYYATKVTRAPKQVYDASASGEDWTEEYASYTSTVKAANVSYRYPSAYALGAVMGNPTANLVVNGKLVLSTGSQFGGLAQTDGGEKAIIEVQSGVNLISKMRTGGIGYYSISVILVSKESLHVGATYRELPARVFDSLSGTVVDMKANTTYFGSSAQFFGLPYKYDLYNSIVGTGSSAVCTPVVVSGTLSDDFKGEWYTADDIYDFKAEYRLDDYIWLNATFKVGSGLTLVSDTTLDLGDGVTFVNANGVCYLVRKVSADELTADIQIDISSLVSASANTFVANGSFGRVCETVDLPNPEEYEGGVENEEYLKAKDKYDKTIALIDTMLIYGEAAEDHFANNANGTTAVVTPADELPGSASIGTQYEATDGEVTIAHKGVTIGFDNCIQFIYGMDLSGDYNWDSVVEIGLMYSMYNSSLTQQHELLVQNPVNAYVLYQSEGLLQQGSLNLPNGVTLNAVPQDSTLSKDKLDQMFADEGCYLIAHNMEFKDYSLTYNYRPYMVLTDGTVVYGGQFAYDLTTYLGNRISKADDTELQLLYATWNYKLAAEAWQSVATIQEG